jgi:hypothetical protein
VVKRGRAGLRDRWRVEVLRTKSVPDACRVLLLVLADHMTDAGYVSIPQATLAQILDVHPRRITERVTQAKRANLLHQRGGYSGRTSEYIALLPGPKVAEFRPPNSVHLSAHEKWTNRTGKVAGNRLPNTRVSYVTTTQQRKDSA